MPTLAKVSIIIPAYNSGKYIHHTINSILSQTHTDYELIIVNDGSTDNTRDVILSYTDSRIIYFEQENGGQCKASNTGLSLAKGDFIKFIDADDIINPNHLKLQLLKLEGHHNSVCGCEWGRFYNNNITDAVMEDIDVWNFTNPLKWLKNVLQKEGDMMSAWLWLIPRNVLLKAGFWDERLSLNNDFEFTIRLLLNSEKVLFAPGAKLYYRTGGETLSVSKSRKAYDAAYLSTKLGCEHLLGAENSPLMRKICADRYQQWVHMIYPKYPDLYRTMEMDVSNLGGSQILHGGGSVFKILRKFFGWKIAKRIQFMAYKTGYKKG